MTGSEARMTERFTALWEKGTPDLQQFLAESDPLSTADLVDILIIDQSQRWRSGHKRPAEGYISLLPGTPPDAGLTLDLIYNEYLNRERCGDPASLEDFCLRFPAHAATLREQVAVHEAIGPGTTESSHTAAIRFEAADGFQHPSVDVPPEYEILAEQGRGGMGVVYRARQVQLNRLVALKVLHEADELDPRSVIRFLAEAEASAAVRHPNVVQVFDYGQHDGVPYLVLEFLPGGTLAEQLKGRGRLDPLEAAATVGKIARGVQAAHSEGIVHRDIKPTNILFDSAGEPKVADFGLAKRSGRAGLTITRALLGTPSYMAPEQASGGRSFVGAAADIWALGVVLYECLTGTRPFEDPDPLITLLQVAEREPETPRHRLGSIPRDLDLICRKCLEKKPADRYASAAELADDLDRFLKDEPISVRPAGLMERGYKWTRRNPALAGLYGLAGVSAVLLTFGAALLSLWQDAVRAREAAEGAQASANAARLDALNELQEAESQRKQADTARLAEAASRKEVEAARKKLAKLEYGRSIQVAYDNWLKNNVAGSLAILATTEPGVRGWEWDYVSRLCQSHFLMLLGHRGEVLTAAFSPDGKRVVTGGFDGTARVWKADTGESLLVIPAHADGVLSAAFSGDGTTILTAGVDAAARIWSADTGKQLAVLNGHTSPINTAAFNHDGSRVLTASGDGTARIWRVTNAGAEEMLSFRKHTGEVRSAAFDSEGMRVVTAGVDGTARVWNARTGEEISKLDHHRPGSHSIVLSAKFSPDGRLVATGCDDQMARVWDAKTGMEVESLRMRGHGGWVYSAAYSSDARQLATASADTTVQLWEPRTGMRLQTLKGHTGLVYSAVFNSGGTQLVTASLDGTARIWNVEPPAEYLALRKQTSMRMADARFSPDGVHVITASEDKTASIWNAETGSEIRVLTGHTNAVNAAVFSPDGLKAATASYDKTVRIWEVRTGAKVSLLEGHTDEIHSVAFHPDGSKVVTASFDGTARIWDWQTARQLHSIDGQAGKLTSAAFSPDGSKVITTGSKGIPRIWNTETGEYLFGLKGHELRVESASFSPDGSRIATASYDGTARVWDANTGAEQLVLRGHTDIVLNVGFNPDGTRLATVGRDAAARIWDAETGAELLSLPATEPNHKWVYSLTFSPDGKKLLTASLDSSARLWDSTNRNSPLQPRPKTPQ